MGKARIGSPTKQSTFLPDNYLELDKELNSVSFENTVPMACQCQPAPAVDLTQIKATIDKRARQHSKAVRKLLQGSDELLAETFNQLQTIKEDSNKKATILHSNLCTFETDLQDLQAKQTAKLSALETMMRSELSKHSHQMELLEEASKVKPVHIKETKTVSTFDYKLVLLNLVLLTLNIYLLLK